MPEQESDSPQSQQIQDDPMLNMVSQLMGGLSPGAAGQQESAASLPPGLAALMGSMGGVGEGTPGQTQQQRNSRKMDYGWKIVHAISAFALGLYVVISSATLARPLVRFKEKQKSSDVLEHDRFNLFWAFATVELVLQSTRYFLEKGRTESGLGSMMGIASSILPKPWGDYLRLIARYSGIWSTIVEDACVLIFMVGVVSWWKGASG